MSVRCIFLGAPENLGFLGRAEALVARRFIGVPKELRSNGERRSDRALYFGMPKSFSEIRDDEGYQPLRPKCRMRLQNYCKKLDKKTVKCTKSEKNAINVEKNQQSCILTII